MSDVSKAEYYRVMAGLAIKADNRYKEEGLEENQNEVKVSLEKLTARLMENKASPVASGYMFLRVDLGEAGATVQGIEAMAGPTLALYYIAKSLVAKIEAEIQKIDSTVCFCEACSLALEEKLASEFGQELH